VNILKVRVLSKVNYSSLKDVNNLCENLINVLIFLIFVLFFEFVKHKL